MNARLFGAALAGMIVPAAEAQLLIAHNNLLRLTPSLGLRGGLGRMASSAVTVLGGLVLFLLGIHHLTEGLKALAGDSLHRAMQTLVGGRLSAVVSGDLFTVVPQSSTAPPLTVIGFVSAGLVTFSQAVGVIAGATFGTISAP